MTPELILTTVAVFVGVAVVSASTASWLFERNAPERRRLRALVGITLPTGVVATAPLSEAFDPTLARLSRLMPRSSKDMTRLQKRMARAGFPQRRSAVYYGIAEIAMPIAGALLAFLALRDIGALVIGAAIGYALPMLYIRHRTTARHKAIQNGLPDALDLLTLCVEAGSALDQAIAKASIELEITHPTLAEELKYITTETRAGKPRLEAFTNFAKRTGVDEVRALVAMLTQTDRFGTSIAQALRTHAETSRTKRRQRAEERAGKVGVKLVFPLALCLFPALYIVCFGPVVVKIYRSFF
jgi:tight adherence protein C